MRRLKNGVLASSSAETWANASTASAAVIPPVTIDDCPYQCTVDGGSVDYLWYSTVLTRTVTIEIIVNRASSGHLMTTATSTLPVDTTELDELSSAEVFTLGGGGGASYIDGTTYVAFSSSVTMFVFASRIVSCADC